MSYFDLTRGNTMQPITIPVPTRDEIEDAIAKVAQPVPPKPKKRHRKAKPS